MDMKLFRVERNFLENDPQDPSRRKVILNTTHTFQELRWDQLNAHGCTYHEVIGPCRFFLDIDGAPPPPLNPILRALNQVGTEGQRIWGAAKLVVLRAGQSSHVHALGGPVWRNPRELGRFVRQLGDIPGLDYANYTSTTNLRYASPKWKVEITHEDGGELGKLVPLRPLLYRGKKHSPEGWFAQASAATYAQKYGHLQGAFAPPTRITPPKVEEFDPFGGETFRFI
jgi:hypothetical protein